MTRRQGVEILLLHSEDDELIQPEDVAEFAEKLRRDWGWPRVRRESWQDCGHVELYRRFPERYKEELETLTR